MSNHTQLKVGDRIRTKKVSSTIKSIATIDINGKQEKVYYVQGTFYVLERDVIHPKIRVNTDKVSEKQIKHKTETNK